MCTNPIRIKSNTKYYTPYKDKLYYSVPCGKCDSCRMEKQSEWVIRTMFHVKDYPRVYVYTLTYREDNVPYFNDETTGTHTMAFSHKDIKDFIDNIRKYMIRRKQITNHEFNYIIASEYGEGKHSPKDKPSTHRPHYHIILFFKETAKVTFRQLHTLLRQFWAVPHGFIYPDIKEKECLSKKKWWLSFPDEKECLMKDANGTAKYISKYITKDINFYKKEEITKYLDERIKKTDKEEWQRRVWKIKRYLPKHWQSKGLGMSLKREVEKRKEYYINGGSWIDPKDLKKYRIPKYIINKFTKINCIHNLNTKYWEQFKKESLQLNKKWRNYEEMTHEEITRMRTLNKGLRKYEIETHNTNLANKIRYKYFYENYKAKILKIQDFINDTKYSSRYKTTDILNMKTTKENQINEQELPKQLAFYLTFIKDREDFLTKFCYYSNFLNKFGGDIQNEEEELIKRLYTEQIKYREEKKESAENNTHYNSIREIYNIYKQWCNDKIKDHVQRLNELKIFYQQLKQKRRNYATI